MTEQKNRQRGRPKGSGRPIKSAAEKQPRRTIAMTEELWQFCLSQPEGAGAFIRKIIAERMKR